MKCLLLITLIAMACATESGSLIKQLKAKPHKQSHFVDNFYGMLELKQNDKLGEVTNVVKGILDKLLATQGSEDAVHAQQSADFEQKVNNLETTLEEVQTELSATNTQIGDLSNDLASLQQSVAFQSKQLLVLNAQVQAFTESRQEEEKSLKESHDSNDKLLHAVQEVIHYLTDTLLNGSPSLVQKQKAMDAAKLALGETHPIYVMLQVTAGHDEETVKRVITKLEQIEQRLQEKLQALEAQSQKQADAFNNIKGQLEGSYDKLSVDLGANTRTVDSKNNDLEIAKRRATELNVNKEQTTDLLEKTRLAKESENSLYNQKHSQILEEISVVQSAYDLLRQHTESQN